MHNFETTVTIQSKELPGVSYVLRKLTETPRGEFRLLVADAYAKIADLTTDLLAIPDDGAIQNLKAMASIERQIRLIQQLEIDPTWVAVCLVSLHGIGIDGKPATPADAGKLPRILWDELVALVKQTTELSGEELKNSGSLTTSGPQVVGETTGITAERVNDTGTTAHETVQSSSLNP